MQNLINHDKIDIIICEESFMSDYNEEAYENALIELFQNMRWEYVYGPEVERDWHSPLYDSVLEDSIRRLNPRATSSAIDEALLKLRHFENAETKKKNAIFMEYLQNGIEVSYHQNGETKSDIIYIADFENAGKPGDKNSYIVTNQWTFIENSNKRPDILLFLNGLPICLFELKSPSREQTDASEADSMGVPVCCSRRSGYLRVCLKTRYKNGNAILAGSAIAPLLKATASPPLLSLTLFNHRPRHNSLHYLSFYHFFCQA